MGIYTYGPKKDTLHRVGPINSGQTPYILNQLRGPLRSKFDYIVLLCGQPLFFRKPTTTSWTTSHAFTLSTVSNTRWKPTSCLLVSILRKPTRQLTHHS